MKPKDFRKKMYMVCSKRHNPVLNTISSSRSESIKKFFNYGDNDSFTWRECKKYGWYTRKYDVDFHPVLTDKELYS